MQTDFYKYVPKDFSGNIQFRRKLLELGNSSKAAGDELWEYCKRDILFYLNAFGWLLEPREDEAGDLRPGIIPFITRDYQDAAILAIQEVLGKKDCAFEKSREVGATWMALYLVDHAWRFHENVVIGLVSKDEVSVDNPDDPDSLMSKLDFISDNIADFLRVRNPRRTKSHHSLVNPETKSSIIGYSATGDVTRGGRKRFMLMDELHSFAKGKDQAAMASTQYVTNCRLVISTPNGKRGRSGAYYDFVTKEGTDIVKVTVRWQDDPQKSRGLYRVTDGVLEIVDKEYEFPDDYEFVRDGVFFVNGGDRSIYYDGQCRRPSATPQAIAAELDLSFSGASSMLFSSLALDEVLRKDCRAPDIRGQLHVDNDDLTFHFSEIEHGPWRLWCPLNDSGLPPQDTEYSVGLDIAVGGGGDHSSNSAIVIFNRKNGHQVAEFYLNTIRPDQLAILAYATGYWFRGYDGQPALVIPETNGIGGLFMTELKRLEYPNIFVRLADDTREYRKEVDKFGIHNRDGGEKLLSEMRGALDRKQCVIRSAALIDELRHFIYKEGRVIHAKAAGSSDESAKGKAHGDIGQAAGCAWHGVSKSPDVEPEKIPDRVAAYGSQAYLINELERQYGSARKSLTIW
jgi:hypothetical protein